MKLGRQVKRILLKMSGEILKGKSSRIFEPEAIGSLIQEIKSLQKEGIQVGMVIGGGNIYRGAQDFGVPFPRVDGDTIGMLATYINALALKFSFEQAGINTRAYASKNLFGIIEEFNRIEAIRYLEEGQVVIFGGGTGNPFFTTDTAAALKALEINADILLKATKVEGIFSEDPEKNPKATHFPELTFDEALIKNLKVMDLTALTLCKENKLPLIVFKMGKGQILEVLKGKGKFSLVRA